MRSTGRRFVFLLAVLGAVGACGITLGLAQRPTLAPYVPTPQDVVDRMLTVAEVTSNDVLYVSGPATDVSSSRRQKIGARGVGIDIDSERITESRRNAREAGVESPGRVSARGYPRRRRVEGHSGHAVPGVERQSQASPAAHPSIARRRPHRVSQVRHGRLDTGEGRPLQGFAGGRSCRSISGALTARSALLLVTEDKNQIDARPLDAAEQDVRVRTPDTSLALARTRRYRVSS